MAILRGPAAAIAVESFKLDPDPPQFESMLSNHGEALRPIEDVMLSQYESVNAPAQELVGDLATAGGVLDALFGEAAAIGSLDESGFLDDLASNLEGLAF